MPRRTEVGFFLIFGIFLIKAAIDYNPTRAKQLLADAGYASGFDMPFLLVEASGRPFAGYFGPKVVLQNWRSASNAEMFPAGFRALGLGKVIGTPTMGAVIGTGSYSLIDGSTVRTPGVGVYLSDPKKTNMENYGVQPDIRVDNLPEDNLAGRDRQLEAAVEELLKQLGTNRRNIASKEEK